MNLPKPFLEACKRQEQAPTEHCLFVNILDQELTHFNDLQSTIIKISTAVNGTGQKEGSFKTPLNCHVLYSHSNLL